MHVYKELGVYIFHKLYVIIKCHLTFKEEQYVFIRIHEYEVNHEINMNVKYCSSNRSSNNCEIILS